MNGTRYSNYYYTDSLSTIHCLQLRFSSLQYIGCTLVVGPKLVPGRGESVVERLLKAAPRKNKRRITITITPEEIYITDMMYRVGAGGGAYIISQ